MINNTVDQPRYFIIFISFLKGGCCDMYKMHKLTNNYGYALVWVLITMVVLSILGVGIYTVSFAETNHAVRSERSMQTGYVARSGVELGFKLLGTVGNKNNVDAIVSAANGLTGLNGSLGNGSYTITYSQQGGAYIVVNSVANNSSDNSIQSGVSLYVPVEMMSVSGDMNWEEAPKSWKRADNLWDNVNPDSDVDVDLTGRSILFTGAPTKSPQNSKDPSTFRATVMLFRGIDNKGVTFLQQNNTNHISFDTEVMIFEGDIRLREPSKTVKLVISDKVTDITKGNLANWSYDGEVGFEDLDRYLDFIGLESEDTGYTEAVAIHDNYEFESGKRYGLVFFDGEILKDGISGNMLTQGDGVYFFKDGIDLNSTPYIIGNTVLSNLMIVDSNDPIRNQRQIKQGTIVFHASDEKQLYIVQ